MTESPVYQAGYCVGTLKSLLANVEMGIATGFFPVETVKEALRCAEELSAYFVEGRDRALQEQHTSREERAAENEARLAEVYHPDALRARGAM